MRVTVNPCLTLILPETVSACLHRKIPGWTLFGYQIFEAEACSNYVLLTNFASKCTFKLFKITFHQQSMLLLVCLAKNLNKIGDRE